MPTSAPALPGTPTWFDLMTEDPDAAQDFYGHVLGWDFTPSSGPEMGHYRMALHDSTIAAGLGKSQQPGMNAWSVYLDTPDVDATTAKVEAAGGTVVAPPMQVADAGRMAIFADPTGAVFGVWENGEHTGAQVRDEPGAMCWCEVNTPDAAKARSFYEQVFGLTTKKMEGMAYWTLHRPDDSETAHAGILQMTEEWGDTPPHWMCYFAVDDVDAALERVKEKGGRVCVPAFDTPYGRMSVVDDAQGATFTLMRMKIG